MKSNFSVQYCVPPENTFLIAEIYYGDEHWAELNTEHNHLQVVFFARQNGEPWRFPLTDVFSVLQTTELEIRRRSVYFDDKGTCSNTE